MKKLSLIFATLLAVVGLSSCSQDTDPVYHAPTTFVLNEPVFANQYYELTEGGEFYLYCSQPDYGYSAVVNYNVQVSLTGTFTAEMIDGVAGDYVTILSTGKGTSAAMNFRDSDLALAMCTLAGVAAPEDMAAAFPAAVKVYFRAIAEMSNIEDSRILSNIVSMNQVLPYFAVPQPDQIWLIGDCGGWKEPAEANLDALAPWALSEAQDAIGSKIYSGVFEIPAGKAMFRFYTALTGWDGGDSWGYQVPDEATDFEDYTEGEWQSVLVNGKGSFSFPNWVGGRMHIIVDMSGDTPVMIINGPLADE